MLLWLLVASPCPSASRTVTIHNDKPRLDVDGNVVDAFGGTIVAHPNGTYFLYGESYGNQTLATPYPWADWPRLKVYTSPDLVSWTLRGDPLPMAPGTLWIPQVVFHEQTQRFIMWYGSGGWMTALSTDGINFVPAAGPFASRFCPRGGGAASAASDRACTTDGTGILVDDDGTGYVAFAAMPPGFDEPDHPGWPGHVAHNYGHIVSIERMTPDLLRTSRVNVTGLFPDDFVESPSLFKRKGRYYLSYGSCCCGCAEGGGQVVFSAPAIEGPWVKQPHADVNCRSATAPICGGYSARDAEVDALVWHAQWFAPSTIPLANGETQVLLNGHRWLSGPNRPEGCFDICGNGRPWGRGNATLCQVGGDQYRIATDFSVWYPLEFDDANGGTVLPMRPLASFELELPELPWGSADHSQGSSIQSPLHLHLQ